MGNTPNIRFKGFTDDWEQRKLSDAIVDIADGPFGSNLKTEHYTDEKEARIIQLSNLSDYGWQEPNTRYTTFEHAKEIRRCIVNEGELVMGKMMPAGMTIIRPNTEKMYVLSSDCVRIKLDKNVATDEFFLYTTKSETFLNQVNNDSQGSTRVRTSISKIREMDFATPSLEEQAKIGEYFTNLDNLITLHQRKCDETKELKKFMLQKMFPKNGEKKPEIRFEGFTDDWEQRKLSDAIVDIADGPFGSNLKTEHYTDEKEARIIQLSNLSDYGWQEPNTRYTTFEHAKEIRRCIVNEGELVMGKMMPAGMTIIRPNTEKMYVLSSDCVRIKLDKNVATDEFFLYTTKSETFLNQVNNDSQGSTRVRTSISKIREMDFATPSLEEQAKIGEYFTNLDNLITLHQRKCDEIKEIKKFMLQNMFPQKG